MITNADINDGRCYWYAAFRAEEKTMVKREGIAIPGFKLKDGAVVKDEKRLDVVTRLKRKASPKKKFVKVVR